jgi:hypothetical protein
MGDLEQRRTERSGGTQIALDQIWRLAGTRTCRALHSVMVGLAVVLMAVVPASKNQGMPLSLQFAHGRVSLFYSGLPCDMEPACLAKAATS